MKKTTTKSPYSILDIDVHNDIVVVDPYLVSIEDLREAGIEKIVRTRRPSWGKGVVHVVVERQSIFDKLWNCVFRRKEVR